MPIGFGGAVLGGSLLSGFLGANAAQNAADTQANAAYAGQALTRDQFNSIQELMKPYVQQGVTSMNNLSPYAAAGAPALGGMQNLAGLNGFGAQQSAIQNIANSPQLQEQMKQGENAMLQNASATGGLRGGNMQGALAQYRPAMLQQAIDQQYSRLAGLTSLGQTTNQNLAQMGQAGAANQATAGMQSASQMANLGGQAAAAQAGGGLAQANIFSNMINGGIGTYAGMGGFRGGSSGFQDVGGMGAASNNYLQSSGIL